MSAIDDEFEAFNRANAAVDLMTCVCGDHVEEHEPVGGGAGRCLVDGCPCVHFEYDPEAAEVVADEQAIAREQGGDDTPAEGSE